MTCKVSIISGSSVYTLPSSLQSFRLTVLDSVTVFISPELNLPFSHENNLSVEYKYTSWDFRSKESSNIDSKTLAFPDTRSAFELILNEPDLFFDLQVSFVDSNQITHKGNLETRLFDKF